MYNGVKIVLLIIARHMVFPLCLTTVVYSSFDFRLRGEFPRRVLHLTSSGFFWGARGEISVSIKMFKSFWDIQVVVYV